jgi:hypothetical protein
MRYPQADADAIVGVSVESIGRHMNSDPDVQMVSRRLEIYQASYRCA